jgi:hypothetical protein
MSKITITEALAEIKTIDSRIAKKREFVYSHLYRQDYMKDPLGDSKEEIRQVCQSISDLEERKVIIRRAIADKNTEVFVTIGGINRSVAEWLIWRREVSSDYKQFLNELNSRLSTVRQDAMRKGVLMTEGEAQSPQDVIVNVNEQELSVEIESLEETLGTLDGQLSLKNATVEIEI